MLPHQLLVVLFVGMTLFPFLAFVIRTGRERPRFVQRDGRIVSTAPMTAAESRAALKERRSHYEFHAGNVVNGLLFPFVWVAVCAWIGRRWFALRI